MLTPFAPDVFTSEYAVRYAGCTFSGRMTIVKLFSGQLLIHSPRDIDADIEAEIEALGPVRFIVAPGNYHHLHIPSCQQAFPSAKTLICPGVERKRPEIGYDKILSDKAEAEYSDEIDQAVIGGNGIINEVAFFHRPSKTLILVDSIENIGDRTPGTNWVLRFWWKYILRMWNVPKPAPEYQMGWKDKDEARRSMERVLGWDFERVIISHGENIVKDAKTVVRQAWCDILGPEEVPQDLPPKKRREDQCCL